MHEVSFVFGTVGWNLRKWVKFVRFRKSRDGSLYATIQMRVPMDCRPPPKGKRTIAYFMVSRETGQIFIDDYEGEPKEEASD